MIQLVEEEREVVLLDFITHKQRAKLRELVTNERLGEEISHIAVRANVKDNESHARHTSVMKGQKLPEKEKREKKRKATSDDVEMEIEW